MISEWEEHKISERQGNANVFKTHHIGAGTEILPGKQHQDSSPTLPEDFPLLYSRVIVNVPLIRRLRGLLGKMLQSALLHERNIDD